MKFDGYKEIMRLTEFEKNKIKSICYHVFGKGDVYLFGSRVYDCQKGGDIDLYICPVDSSGNMIQKKIDFLIDLKSVIGDQKIDVIIAQDSERLVEQEAIRTGILL